MSVCAYVLVGRMLHNKIIRNLGLYMEFVFSFDASYMSHELPRHKKMCFRSLRPGSRHKSGFTAKEASWRLEFGFKERTSTFDFAVAQ